MFAIGGNMHVSAYKDTKYEPLDIILEAQEEVSSGHKGFEIENKWFYSEITSFCIVCHMFYVFFSVQLLVKESFSQVFRQQFELLLSV